MLGRDDPIGISTTTGKLVKLDPNKKQISYIRYTQEEEWIFMQCPTCQTELPSTHAAFDMQSIRNYVDKNGGWDVFSEGRYRGKITTFNLPNGKSAEVVARKTTYDSGDIGSDYYDGELPQGSTFNTFIVIKVGDAYFRKTGTGDSYGEVSWDGELTRVTPKEKVILTFE